VRAWLRQHARALRSALGKLAAQPAAAGLNALVIGIALSMPAGGYAVLSSLRAVAAGAALEPQLSAFLRPDVKRGDAEALAAKLRGDGRWRDVRFVPREQALKELQSAEGLADVVAALNRNPLPDALVLRPRASQPEAVDALAREMRALPAVAQVLVDTAWVRRLQALAGTARLAIGLLAGLLAFGLVAITFNTIRLQILAQADEIEVAKLIGATDGFIRRPYYYFGALQGILGGLIAMLLVSAAVAVLSGPVSQLASLYATAFRLHGLGLDHSLLLLGVGALLGWLGAQLSVGLYLRQIEPK